MLGDGRTRKLYNQFQVLLDEIEIKAWKPEQVHKMEDIEDRVLDGDISVGTGIQWLYKLLDKIV